MKNRFEKIQKMAAARAEFLSLEAETGQILTFSSDPESGLPEIDDLVIVGADSRASGDYVLLSGDRVEIRNGVVTALRRKADSPGAQFFKKRAQQKSNSTNTAA